MKKIFLLCLALSAGLFLSPAKAYSAGYWESEEKTLSTRSISFSCSYTHNSNGYWTLDSGSGGSYFYDFQINYSTGLVSTLGSANLTYSLPSEVVSALSAGKTVNVYIESPDCCTNADISGSSAAISGISFAKCSIKVCPHVSSSINSFVSGLNPTIPLIDSSYGQNLYTVYPTIGSAVTSPGWYSASSPYYVNSPYIHPSRIASSNGSFKSGTSIFLNGSSKSATFYTIGKNGSFSEGTAVRLNFYCPFKLRFTVVEKYYIEDASQQGSGTSTTPQTPSEPAKPPQKEEELPDTKPSPKLRLHRTI